MGDNGCVLPLADMPIDHVVFDLGGVVLRGQERLTEIARLIGAPTGSVTGRGDGAAAAFRTAYDTPRLAYDRTSDSRAYWSAVAAAAGAPQPDTETIAALTDLDTAGWLGTDSGTLAVIDELYQTGMKLAILSNAPASMGDAARRQPWARPFRTVLISGELGVVKPDPEIYEALLTALRAPAERVMFIDDRADNVASARDLGIRAVRFTGAGALRHTLADAGLLSARPGVDAAAPSRRT